MRLPSVWWWWSTRRRAQLGPAESAQHDSCETPPAAASGARVVIEPPPAPLWPPPRMYCIIFQPIISFVVKSSKFGRPRVSCDFVSSIRGANIGRVTGRDDNLASGF
jgi:hypothetical protein